MLYDVFEIDEFFSLEEKPNNLYIKVFDRSEYLDYAENEMNKFGYELIDTEYKFDNAYMLFEKKTWEGKR
ncbi:hypothetical protein [Marinitoga sp. 1138]|uniref:hypothetical protein n=1 Tax=Marinitoga sp. 1138 TaxID=1643334 RepID=UPI001586D471|nr:hypothetical protein [Marinitoga sp. 1138]NUU96751.1 hypothetical protein [Marinitoga sp. 1138]